MASSFAETSVSPLPSPPKLSNAPPPPDPSAPAPLSFRCAISDRAAASALRSLATRSAALGEFSSNVTVGVFTMFLALFAYLSVFRVSSRFASAGEMHATITVREFPPSESCSRRVSLESR